MLNILLKNILVYDSTSEFHDQTVDILIKDGIISTIDWNLPEFEADIVINGINKFVTNNFTDLRCHSSDPGFEHRETLETLNKIAIRGGFGKVALLPNSKPIRQNKSTVDYIIKNTQTFQTKFLPLGAITNQTTDDNLNELYDMHQYGAVGFSNADNSIKNSGTLSKALLYSKMFDSQIFSFSLDDELMPHSSVTEGAVAVSLGLKGQPVQAEYLMVQRDLEIADYHQCNIHFNKISTAKSVEIIRQAKAQGIKVTCDVAVMNLVLTDEAILDFDSNLKLKPPLRQASDVKALWEGIEDGSIDAICTDHNPLEIEKKELEFNYADFGCITLQIAFNLAIEGRNRFAPNIEDSKLVTLFNLKPSKILKQNFQSIKEGNSAELVVFDTTMQTTLTKNNNQSLSSNTYYMNKPLPYKILFNINQNQYFLNQ